MDARKPDQLGECRETKRPRTLLMSNVSRPLVPIQLQISGCLIESSEAISRVNSFRRHSVFIRNHFLMMESVTTTETFYFCYELTRLIDREDLITFSCHEILSPLSEMLQSDLSHSVQVHGSG